MLDKRGFRPINIFRYKMLKSMRRKGGKEADGISRNSKTEEPVLLFGPPSMIDPKKAQKLARLFGVETNNRRRKGAPGNLSSAIEEWFKFIPKIKL